MTAYVCQVLITYEYSHVTGQTSKRCFGDLVMVTGGRTLQMSYICRAGASARGVDTNLHLQVRPVSSSIASLSPALSYHLSSTTSIDTRSTHLSPICLSPTFLGSRDRTKFAVHAFSFSSYKHVHMRVISSVPVSLCPPLCPMPTLEDNMPMN